MFNVLDRVARAWLQGIDPETAHGLALSALRLNPFSMSGRDNPALAVTAFGLRFPNPIGVAAGFDKNAEAVDGVLRAGFGFAEVGTVTPLAQPGNPKPRIVRLAADEAVINRLGFNNAGHEAAHAHLTRRGSSTAIVGVNIGANKDSPDRVADYVAGIGRFADVASYFTVNVSSPNTPGLRDLQQASALDELLGRVMDARNALPIAQRRPVLLKIAPDLSLSGLDDVVAIARRRATDGMIVSNTTITRPLALSSGVSSDEAGGLSGRPLFALATRMLAETFVRVEGAFPLIGVGGIDSGPAAVAKMRAGAALLQLYSALVYRGISLLAGIKTDLAKAAAAQPDGLAGLVGADARARVSEPWPE
jgi:dihydroorotate dehydrogenase